MPTIRLGDADRERFGCQEWLSFDERIETREAEAYEDAGGDLGDFGQVGKVRRWRAIVWLALHRSGITLPFAEVHFEMNGVLIEEEPGKALSGAGASRTRRTSASSTRRSTRSGSKS